MNLPEGFTPSGLPEKLTVPDKWIISRLNSLASDINDNLEKFELGIAASNLYDFIWDVYCDWYIEITKPRLQAEDKSDVLNILFWCLEQILKLLHPFMPFITEEIWSHLHDSLIMLETYPVYDKNLHYPNEEREFAKVIDAIKAVRAKRAEMNVVPSVKAKLIIETKNESLFNESADIIKKLAYASDITVINAFQSTSDMVTAVTADAKLFIPFGDLVDVKKELERLTKEKLKVQKDIDFSSKKLSNPGFTGKAPAAQIEAEREKLKIAEEKMQKINESLKLL
jgi:valyl-tRNA synthetase